MLDLEKIKPKVENVGRLFDLALIVLYGSQASGKAQKESDIDVAVLGKRPLKFDQILEIGDELADIFETKNIDVKSLHFADPLFRYEVTRSGILFYGNSHYYNNFKAYAFRDYHDSRDLFRLKEIIIKKRLDYLKALM